MTSNDDYKNFMLGINKNKNKNNHTNETKESSNILTGEESNVNVRRRLDNDLTPVGSNNSYYNNNNTSNSNNYNSNNNNYRNNNNNNDNNERHAFKSFFTVLVQEVMIPDDTLEKLVVSINNLRERIYCTSSMIENKQTNTITTIIPITGSTPNIKCTEYKQKRIGYRGYVVINDDKTIMYQNNTDSSSDCRTNNNEGKRNCDESDDDLNGNGIKIASKNKEYIDVNNNDDDINDDDDYLVGTTGSDNTLLINDLQIALDRDILQHELMIRNVRKVLYSMSQGIEMLGRRLNILLQSSISSNNILVPGFSASTKSVTPQYYPKNNRNNNLNNKKNVSVAVSSDSSTDDEEEEEQDTQEEIDDDNNSNYNDEDNDEDHDDYSYNNDNDHDDDDDDDNDDANGNKQNECIDLFVGWCKELHRKQLLANELFLSCNDTLLPDTTLSSAGGSTNVFTDKTHTNETNNNNNTNNNAQLISQKCVQQWSRESRTYSFVYDHTSALNEILTKYKMAN